MDIYEFIDKIQTREDFIKFVTLLRKDFSQNQEEWENPTLERYLEGLEQSAEDIDGKYLNRNENFPVQPSWKLLAELLLMAAYYE